MDRVTTMEMKEEEVQISIPHVTQKHTWDCGLACAQMILSYCEEPFEDFDNVCQQLEFNTSVWTIDLARILTHYSVKHSYVTVTFGVDKEYSKKSFYKERFDRDQKRVDNLFNDADALGLSVRKGAVEVEEIVQHLLTLCPLIALVDANLLKCLWCNSLVSCTCLGQCLGGLGGYQGHYVVICGFNSKQKVFYYQNPAHRNNELCCCTMKVFDRARMAHGTDQDLIFIQHRKTAES